MKRFFAFFDTMAGRIFALLFIGLVLAGTIGVRLSALERAGALEDLQYARAADRVAAYLFSEEALASKGDAALSGNTVPGVHGLEGPAPYERVNEALSRHLQRRLPELRQATAYDVSLQTCFPGVPERAAPAGDNPYWRLRPPSCWVAQLEFAGAPPLWLSIETPMTIVNTPSAFDPLFMSALFAGAVVLAFVVARLAAAPLRRLSRSAAQLGENFDGAGFEEAGPVEVRAAASALNRMQERIGRQVVERTRMLSAIAHDLQTPLTRMRLRLDQLEKGELYEKFYADMDEMRQLVREGLDLAYDVMPEENAVQLDLDSLLDSIVSDAADMGAEVSFEERSGCDVMARPLALKRCIVNLLNNAVRYGCEVEVRAQMEGDAAVKVRILDRGPGIPEGQLEAVLQPFRQLETRKEANVQGTGLGLAIANRFALLNGGVLRLRNRPEGGLCAELELPVSPPSN